MTNPTPSVAAPATAMDFNPETKRLFVGMDNGSISEFNIATDYNRISHQRNYLAHLGRVTGVIFSIMTEWVLSVGRDKNFQYVINLSLSLMTHQLLISLFVEIRHLSFL